MRNSLFFELGLENNKNRVRLIQYEELVQNPRTVMNELFNWFEVDWNESAFRYVHSRSVGKPNLPKLNPEVDALCHELHGKLDQVFTHHWH